MSPPQPGGAIALTPKFFPLAFFFFFVKPFVAIDGHVVPATWNRMVVPVPPGQHHVYVHTPYFLPAKVGPAETAVAVAPGQVVELEYRAPLVVFAGGSLGPPPQKYNGLVLNIVLLAVVFLIFVCFCAVAISGANS